MLRFWAGFALPIMLASFAGIAAAHVTVRPAEASLQAETTYTIRVPTEGTVPTTGLEIFIPEPVTILSVGGDPGSYETTRIGERITSIVWRGEIPPGQHAEFTFTARNPPQGAEIVWKALQFYQDGTRAEWIEPKGSKRPAPVTSLKSVSP